MWKIKIKKGLVRMWWLIGYEEGKDAVKNDWFWVWLFRRIIVLLIEIGEKVELERKRSYFVLDVMSF